MASSHPARKTSAKPGHQDVLFHGSPLSYFTCWPKSSFIIDLKKKMSSTCFITASQKLSLPSGPDWNLIFSHSLLTPQGAETESLGSLRVKGHPLLSLWWVVNQALTIDQSTPDHRLLTMWLADSVRTGLFLSPHLPSPQRLPLPHRSDSVIVASFVLPDPHSCTNSNLGA